MKFKLILIASCLLLICACGKKTDNKPNELAHGNGSQQMHSGKVLDTMNSGGYTYVEIEENGEKIWAAALETVIVKGEQVTFPGTMPMENFESKTLNRKFSKIYFVNTFTQADSGKKIEKDTPPSNESHATVPKLVEGGSIAKAPGGYTVAECYAQKKNLSGKTVKIHAKIVKVSSQIMGKNWIHLQDGSGAAGSNDLTITTSKKFENGQMVLVTGTLQTDKHIGPGYDYPVIIEEPTIEVK